MTLIEAIARMEGFYSLTPAPNRPQRNNNPGDLEWGEFSRDQGAVKGDPRFAIFPTAAEGWAALYALLSGPDYAPLTIEAAINKFAPPIENDTMRYVDLVCVWVNCAPDEIVADVLGAASASVGEWG